MSNKEDIANLRLDTAISMFPNVYVTPVIESVDKNIPIAKELLKPNTREIYEACEWQYTILPLDENKLSDILNDYGVKFYANVMLSVNAKEFKDTIYNPQFANKHSGMWIADKSSPYHKDDECLGCLNSWTNVVVSGRSEVHDKDIVTSPCIFITSDWCYTRSGSLYKLIRE
jgi:hypothetical protein